MNSPRLALRQVRFTNKAFWRNPASAFFTFAFPLMFLVIFTSLLGSGNLPINGVSIKRSWYFVGAMAGFGVISACFTNIAITVTFQRDQGILKRLRGTPLPAWAYLFSRVVHAMFVAAILVVITMVFGALLYDAPLPTGLPLLEFFVALVVGALSFSALALALTGAIPNADAAPPMVNAVILPLLFLSGIFIPLDDTAPGWIKLVGKIFPVKHFVDSLYGGFLGGFTFPAAAGGSHVYPFHWNDVLVVGVWGIVGLLLAARSFSWEPRR
ncbi:MAG: type transport system permease protein [Actinomycetota bacterium]|jgi:ABC-2 type transport system permease protein|nr:type transport system permease protein [Actinomycetota bacterium]